MTNYVRINLANASVASDPGPLPAALRGLAAASLADLPAALDPVPEDFAGVGYWPAEVINAEYDPRAEILDNGFAFDVDVDARMVVAERLARPMTPEELAAVLPLQHPPLGKLEFIGLVQQAGGMSDVQLVAAQSDANLTAFWVKYQMASQVLRDHPVTAQALGALDALGYIPNGAQAVLDAWPTQ